MCHVQTNLKRFGSYHRTHPPQIKIQHIEVFPHHQWLMSVLDRQDRTRTRITSTLHSSTLLISNLTMKEIRQRMGKSYVKIPEEMLGPFGQKGSSRRCRPIRSGKHSLVKPKRLIGCVVMRSRIPIPRI